MIKKLTLLRDDVLSLDMAGTADKFNISLKILILEKVDAKINGVDRVCFTQGQTTRLRDALSHAVVRIYDDLSLQKVFVIHPSLTRYYDQVKLFGDEVFTNFPSAASDIVRSGSCLALGRGTACVMHVMRVIEVGLNALAGELGIGKQNDWGKYLTSIDNELAARMKLSRARSPNEQFYAESAHTIDNMRRAFRNPTMHPEKVYSTERAEEILASIGSFMRHLATKVSE